MDLSHALIRSEVKFSHKKHVIADVKLPVGRNRLDIEAKVEQGKANVAHIDNHTHLSLKRYQRKTVLCPCLIKSVKQEINTTDKLLRKVRKTNWENHWSS